MTDPLPPELRLAGDIAAQFAHRARADAAAAVATHIRTFWEPRMRRALLDAVAAADTVEPTVRAAAALLGSATADR